jgi:heptosyltransferase-3
MEKRLTASRILVHRLGSLGDTIVALPCFHFLRRNFPAAEIILLTNFPVSQKAAPAMTIMDGTGLVDGAIAYPMGARSVSQLIALRRTIRDRHFDLGVTLCTGHGPARTFRDATFLKLCGIRRVVGANALSSAATQCNPDGVVTLQECVRIAERLSELGDVDPSDRAHWDLMLSDEERASATSLLQSVGISGPFLAASLGTKVPANDWGNVNWVELLSALYSEYPGLSLVMVGSPDESERCDAMLKHWKGPFLNACGKTTPRGTAALFERCALFIGHDSGPAHLAAAVGARVIAIFSWYNPPGKWFPGHSSWDNVHVLYPPLPSGKWQKALRNRRGLNEGVLAILPSTVIQLARDLLAKTPHLQRVTVV